MPNSPPSCFATYIGGLDKKFEKGHAAWSVSEWNECLVVCEGLVAFEMGVKGVREMTVECEKICHKNESSK